MKLIEIKKDEHYIVVDGSEIKEGDWIYNVEREPSIIQCIGKGSLRGWRKITHSTQPGSLGMGWMQSVQPLFLSEVKELTGEVDVEKKAQIQWGNVHRTGVLGYIEGYNQCLEDNKDRKYTEEDMRKAYYQGHKSGLGSESSLTFEKTIESLLPKTEWEVEFNEQSKLKLI